MAEGALSRRKRISETNGFFCAIVAVLLYLIGLWPISIILLLLVFYFFSEAGKFQHEIDLADEIGARTATTARHEFVPEHEGREIKSHRPVSESLKCEKCGAPVKDEDKFCHNCGEEFIEESCSKCGKPASPGHKFCSHCGKSTIKENSLDVFKK